LNPFARKKYVQRQVAPIKNRVNELDELTANNTKMLKDVDARATAGIQMASNRAGEADQKAMLAGQHAQEANQTAQQASTRLQSVEQVVGSIDDYKSTGSAELKFRAGQTTLSKSSKEEIDQMVASLANQRGYVIQVQGFSPGRGQEAIQSSQTMAQAVARYLVVEHQIPVYRIFVVGMGNAPVQSADGQAKKVRGGRVEVSVLKNGLDQLQQSASVSAPSQGGAAGAAYNSGAPATSDNAPANAVGNSAQQAPWQKSSTPQQQQQQQQQQNQQPK
jgi:outer membrane protein OmpA-like peptidoglycan-associated protein